MYKKYFLVDVLKSTGVCQLPVDITERYVEFFLVENNRPLDLTGCVIEVKPSQEKVEILKHKSGCFLVKFLDSVNEDFTLQLTIYQQAFIRAMVKFDVEFLKKRENIQLAPDYKQSFFSQKTKVRFIAHRGLSSLAPENTLPAYELAGKYGYFGAECDIHESLDGEFVLMHDDSLQRMTNEKGSIRDYTKNELKEFEIKDARYPHLKIPTLTEYLQVCKYEELVPIIEIKRIEKKSITKLLNQIKNWGLTSGCIIITFHQDIATEVRKQNKEIKIQWLADLTKENIDYCAQYQMDIDCPKRKVNKKLVDYAHSKGVLVNVWTVDDVKDMMKLMDMGVDFITTNCLMHRHLIRGSGMYESYRMKNRIDYLKWLNPFFIECHGDVIEAGTFKWHGESQIFELKGSKQAPTTIEVTLPPLYKGDVVTVSCHYLNLSDESLKICFGDMKKEFEQVMETTLMNDWGYVELQFICLNDSKSMIILIGSEASSHLMLRNINIKIDYV